MTEFYSPSRGGFFDDQINRAIPDDCVPLQPGQRQALHAALATGKVIRVTDAGAVQAVAPPPPDPHDRRSRLHVAVKREAARRILTVAPMWQQINDLRIPDDGGHVAELAAARSRGAAIDAIRAASNALDTAIDTTSARALAKLDVTSACHWPPATPETAPQSENAP